MIDAIQEFKVQSHDKAESGGVVGGMVNIISKSGTNKLHGSVFEFARNNFFDARDPFKDVSSSGPAPFRQNEFGATLGGRIIRDRTFFFLSVPFASGTMGLPFASHVNGTRVKAYSGWPGRHPAQAICLQFQNCTECCFDVQQS